MTRKCTCFYQIDVYDYYPTPFRNSAVVPFFAVFIALWASLYLASWRRRQKRLAMEWGMVGYEGTVEARPEFYGTYKPHPVTGEPYLYFPKRDYSKRVLQSTVIIGVLIGS